MTNREEAHFTHLVEAVNRDGKLDQMKAFIQHGNVTTYDHVLSVAKMSYKMNLFLKAKADEQTLVRGALLHDYFLYDWHTWNGPLHGPYHPKAALKNAKRDFDLNETEENIIRSHMWPLTLFHYPKTREAVIVCIADKIISTKETLFLRGAKHGKKESTLAETGKTD